MAVSSPAPCPCRCRCRGRPLPPVAPCLLLLALLLLGSHSVHVDAVKIIVTPGKTECFSEPMDSYHFTIPGGARIDGRVIVTGTSQYYVPFVTITVEGPKGNTLWQEQHVYTEAHFNVPAPGPGQYRVCFLNPHDSRTDASIDLVYFTLAHLRSAPGAKVVLPKGTEGERSTGVAHKDQMEELQRTVISMNEFVQVIMGSQRYLQRKLDHHLRTVTSSKDRTLNYAWLEVVGLLLVMGVQVFAVTKLFEKTRTTRVLHV